MEDKCKLNFDLHVCHQLLNTQAKISQFLSARAKEKKTHKQGKYKTHHERKTLDWYQYQALEIFHRKIQTKTHPQERKKFSFPLAEEREKRKTFFSHTYGSLGSSLRGSSGHMVFQSPVIFVAMMRCKRIGEIDQNEGKFHL